MSAHAKLGAGNPKCPRCHKSVYANEKIIALGQDYHIQCLKCASCNKRLDAQHLTEHKNEIYCTGCYNAKFGPKGFGYVSAQHTEGGTGEEPVNSPRNNAPEADTPAVGAAKKFCSECGTPLTPNAKFCASCGHKL